VIWQKIGINSFKIRVLTHKQTKQVYRIYRLLLNIQKSTDTLTHLIVIMSVIYDISSFTKHYIFCCWKFEVSNVLHH